MNRIAIAIAAIVFFLVACSNSSNNPIEGGTQGEDSSSSVSGDDPPRGNGPDSEPGQQSAPSMGNPGNSSPSQGAVSSSSGAQSVSSSSGGGGSSSFSSSSAVRSSSSIVIVPIDPKSFTETVNGVSFDMIYIPGGTFTIGCEKESGCPANSKAVEGVAVSNYFIGKTEVTTGLWNAVMGVTCSGYMCQTSSAYTKMTWYDAQKFACELSKKTDKHYRMMTEAEFEYAAKNHLSSLEKIGGSNNNEEWAYNTWNASHSGGVDPIGPVTRKNGEVTWGHTQKTRRDANGTGDNITGRLIRSIEGIGPVLRLVISADAAYPPNMISPCDIHAPEMEGEPANSYRDPRWITGDTASWKPQSGTGMGGSFNLKVWADGTARFGRNNGQWFTSNNITLVFVPTSGTAIRFAYIFLNGEEGSLITDQNDYMKSEGFIGRIAREDSSAYPKPTVANLMSGEDLAKAQSDFNERYKMVNMENIPASAKQQDKRLLDGLDSGWFQNNIGSAHHYRKDVDLDEFRFTVNQGGQRIILANGEWFTVNNTFLRVKHKDGYTADYLYGVTPSGNFYHNSFMGYERGDFRSFTKTLNGEAFNKSCGTACDGEIPKGLDASMYSNESYMGEVGRSTFVPAPCPAGGCR